MLEDFLSSHSSIDKVDLEDLYETTFDVDAALANDKIEELAGNYIIIKHNETEYSHLNHLLKGSCVVKQGDFVKRDQEIAKVGFSGASTIYSHLHYQLLNGRDMLNAHELPIKFSDVVIWKGSEKKIYKEVIVNTGDIIQRNE
jgi:murein DD-endopeptidase MepM/ murein hydrolase activator NlpD